MRTEKDLEGSEEEKKVSSYFASYSCSEANVIHPEFLEWKRVTVLGGQPGTERAQFWIRIADHKTQCLL